MKLLYLCITFVGLLERCTSAVLSSKYKAIYGKDSTSGKANMSVMPTQSRIQCSRACDMIQGCGGFNFRMFSTGIIQCEFKQGISDSKDSQKESDATYYQKTDQEPYIISRDCYDLQASRISNSGVYEINLNPDGVLPKLISVYCDMDTDSGGWTVLAKRQDGSVDFDVNWINYRNGFGNLTGEHWLGLENMYNLTNSGRSYKLRVDIQLFNGNSYYAVYNSFRIGPEEDGYTLQVSGYIGNAGDALDYHNNVAFSTFDVDNDAVANFSCAATFHGGFWYKMCSDARLTGLYGSDVPPTEDGDKSYKQGIFWTSDLEDEHPKYVDMKIRPSC